MKKNIKYVIILLIILFVTGCQKQYNLYVKNDSILEEIDIVITDDEDNNNILKLDYYPLHSNDEITYNKEITKKNNMLNAHFNYTYTPYDFVNANSINDCFKTKQIIVDNDEYYYFKVSNLTECMSNSNLDINIITENKVLTNNADKVRGNKYTWYLREKNKQNFELEIKISKTDKRETNYIAILIVSLMLIFLTITTIYFINKKSKSNNI